jgi:hypothetical protein
MQGYYTIHKVQKICTDKTQVNMENPWEWDEGSGACPGKCPGTGGFAHRFEKKKSGFLK